MTSSRYESKNKIFITLFLIIALGAVLRFYGLNNQSLWNDELSSWYRSSHESIAEVIKLGVIPDVHPPGYQIILYYVERIFGDSEEMLRFPSAAAGVISIFMIYLVGRTLYTYKEGLIASSLMAFLWCPIYYSQEARPYSLLLLFTLVSTYFWINLITVQEGQCISYKPLKISAYIISAIITSYLHYFGLFLIALQGFGAVIFLFGRRGASRYVFTLYTPIILAYLPWWPTFWQHLNKGPIWITPPDHTAFSKYLMFCFNNSNLVMALIVPFYCFYFFRSAFETSLFTNIDKNNKFTKSTLIVMAWFLIPFMFSYTKSLISAPILTDRNLIISIPAIYIILARAFTVSTKNLKNKTTVILVILTVVALQNILINRYYTEPHKQQFREAVKYVIDHNSIDIDNSIIIGYAWRKEYFDYYFEKQNSKRKVDLLAGRHEDIPLVSKIIKQRSPEFIWLIAAHKFPDQEFLAFMENKFHLVAERSLLEANVWLFKKSILVGG